MKRKLLYAFLIVMLLINVALLYLIIDKKMNKGPSRGQTFITEQLQFSEDQKDQFFELDREHRKVMMRIDNESKDIRERLFGSLDEEVNSRDSLLTRFANLEVDRQQELFSFFAKVRKLCNEDQAKKFDEIIQEVLHRREPKAPPKRKP